MEHLQLRGAVDLDVSQHPYLYAGGKPDSGRYGLETGGAYGVPGQHDCAGAHAAELASGSALWDSLSGAGAGFLWRAGRKRGGSAARLGGVRMVWLTKLDRRGRHQKFF